LIAPLNLALLPIYLRLWRTDGPGKTAEFLSVGLDLFLMAAVLVLAVSTATAHDAVTLLASSKYSAVDGLIPIIIAGLLVYTTHLFFAAGLLIHKNTRVMALLLVVSAVLNMALNCILLPRYGLKMAAIATLISYLVCVILLARFSLTILPLHIEIRAVVRYALAGVSAWFVASRLSFEVQAVSLVIRGIVVLGVYAGLLFLFDRRLRAMAGYVLRAFRSRSQAVKDPIEADKRLPEREAV
jgi:O-antigen/teichoic acid export membrane protein